MRHSQQIRALAVATETIRGIRDLHRDDPAVTSACLSILEDHGRLYQLVLEQTDGVDPGVDPATTTVTVPPPARYSERVDEIRGAV